MTLEPLHPALIAADYAVAAVGVENAPLLASALEAGWMTDEERTKLADLAAGVRQLTD